MKKKAALYIILTPFIYLYGLAENHFNFSNSVRGYTLEFIYEYVNAWKILFGKEYKDNSVKIAEFEYKLKAKKAKFNLDIAIEMKKLYGSWSIRFDKKERKLTYNWSSDYGSTHLSIRQIDNDQFNVNYYNDTGWNRDRKLITEYIFTKEDVISTIQTIKEKE